MTIASELKFTIILMVFMAIALALFIIRHSKKIVLILAGIIAILGFRAYKLGVAEYYYNQAKDLATEVKEDITPDRDNEGVDLPDAEDGRFMYYYDTGARGFGLPDENAEPGILQEYFLGDDE